MFLLFSVEKYTPLYIPSECASSARLLLDVCFIVKQNRKTLAVLKFLIKRVHWIDFSICWPSHSADINAVWISWVSPTPLPAAEIFFFAVSSWKVHELSQSPLNELFLSAKWVASQGTTYVKIGTIPFKKPYFELPKLHCVREFLITRKNKLSADTKVKIWCSVKRP